jgi:hypothetical protein
MTKEIMEQKESKGHAHVRIWSTRSGNRLIGGLLLSGMLLIWISLWIWRQDVIKTLSFPCVFHELTGWNCIGCGGTRMVAALLNGDVLAAWCYNPLLLVMMTGFLFLIGWMIIRTFYKQFRPISLSVKSRWWLLVLLILIIFLIVRNTAWYQQWFY